MSRAMIYGVQARDAESGEFKTRLYLPSGEEIKNVKEVACVHGAFEEPKVTVVLEDTRMVIVDRAPKKREPA